MNNIIKRGEVVTNRSARREDFYNTITIGVLSTAIVANLAQSALPDYKDRRWSSPARLRACSPGAVMVGRGITGCVALDLADAGLKVHLVEQTPPGRAGTQLATCPAADSNGWGTPDHGYGCTRPRSRSLEHNQHPNIDVLNNTHIIDIQGQAGDFTVSLRQEPRYVDAARCINCGDCAEVCPVELPDSYQQNMSRRKAIYKVAARASPDAYVIDRGPYCDDCGKCRSLPGGGYPSDEPPRLRNIEVGAIILALGFQVYDPSELEELATGAIPTCSTPCTTSAWPAAWPHRGVSRPSDGSARAPLPGCNASARATRRTPSAVHLLHVRHQRSHARQAAAGWCVECSIFIGRARSTRNTAATSPPRASATAFATSAAASPPSAKTRPRTT